MLPSTRRGLLVAAASLAGLGLSPRTAFGARQRALALLRVSARNVGRPFSGDRDLFATVAPGVPGRDTAAIRFGLTRPARVQLEAIRSAQRQGPIPWSTAASLPAGEHVVRWTPDADTPVGSYVIRLTLEGRGGARKVYGGRRPGTPERAQAPVVRVLGVEAAFERRSYAAEERMGLTIQADAPRLTLQFLKVGDETLSTGRNDELSGVPMGDPVTMDWRDKRSAPRQVVVQTGVEWPTGLYAARLQTDDGRTGYAPFVLRPTRPGGGRTAVVLPTHTWQVYNFYDRDGDGWGDTWYAGGSPAVALDRPYQERGVPPRFRRNDLPFLKWLGRTGRRPDVLADDDLEAYASGDDLRRSYDLVVFPGHSEYVTEHAYDVVSRFRDLGGRLVFLSANNFFWKIDKRGNTIRRVKRWRELGRPEARLCGVQYRANDDGGRQGEYLVAAADKVPWLFERTGLENGSSFGDVVGGFGIEIDARTPASPPGTVVVALVPNLFGPGLSAEMTYYETAAGARVFSAGTLDFCTSVMTWPMWKLLDNLWRHMLEDLPLPPGDPVSSAG